MFLAVYKECFRNAKKPVWYVVCIGGSNAASWGREPAANTSRRTHGLAADRPPFTLGSFSPFGRTNPPNGIQFREKVVSRHWKSFTARGGKPSPNSSISTPKSFDAKKCPNSWTMMSSAIAPIKTASSVISKENTKP